MKQGLKFMEGNDFVMPLAFLLERSTVSGWTRRHKLTLFPGFGRFSGDLISVRYVVEFGFAVSLPGRYQKIRSW